EFSPNHFSEHHRAMAAARATQGNRQVTLPFADVVRDQIGEQIFDAAQELAGLRKRANVARDLGIFSAERSQPGHEMRIGQKAHVEYEIGVGRNPITESETDHGNQQGLTPWILKTIDDELAQLVDVEFRGVDDYIGGPADGRHPAALEANAF